MGAALRPSQYPSALRAKALDMRPRDERAEWAARLAVLMDRHGVSIPELRLALGTSMRDVHEIVLGQRRLGVDQIGILARRPETAWKRFAAALADEVFAFVVSPHR